MKEIGGKKKGKCLIVYKINESNEVYRTLVELCDAYNPPLITKIGNLSEYANKLVENADIYS